MQLEKRDLSMNFDGARWQFQAERRKTAGVTENIAKWKDIRCSQRAEKDVSRVKLSDMKELCEQGCERESGSNRRRVKPFAGQVGGEVGKQTG